MKPAALVLSLGFLAAIAMAQQPKRVLYITHSAGYRHDSIPVSVQALQAAASASGKLEVIASEDLSLLSVQNLDRYDAVFFFTSGELPISDAQKQALLDFVRSGKGFGGVHSATDTFYSWPEYGELIGARFNGHPWVQQIRIDVEDPNHPAVAHLAPGFSIADEIYQFSEFSRDRVRVLLTIDTKPVDLGATGVNPGTEDFPLAWCRNYGSGRVFYTALGHLNETWRDPRFATMMLLTLLWLTGQVNGDAAVRPTQTPALAADGIANSASFTPRMTVSPGSLITIFGSNLTNGSQFAGDPHDPPYKLVGTTVKLNGSAVPVLYASPSQVNAYVPLDFKAVDIDLQVSAGGAASVKARVTGASTTPGIFATTATRSRVTLWTTGLGAVHSNGGFSVTNAQPEVNIGGAPAKILYSGLAPGWIGLYQVDVEIPANVSFPARLEFRFEGAQFNATLNP